MRALGDLVAGRSKGLFHGQGRMTGHLRNVAAHCGQLTDRDRGVRADPGVDLPWRRAVEGSRRVRLLDGLGDVADGLGEMITQDGGDLGHRQSRRSGEVQRPTVVRAIAGQDRNRKLSNVGLGHERNPPVARWSTDVPIGAKKVRREVGIDVVAQDRMGNADRAQMLLGCPGRGPA